MGPVLVVDDNEVNQELMCAFLESVDAEIATASSGEEALHALGELKPDVILLDVLMPGLDGFEVCRRIKSDPGTRMIPVVMVTGLNQTAYRVQALEAGADDFIAKPVEQVEIVARVRSLLRVKALLDRLDDSERVMLSLARAVEAKDAHTEAHVERVAQSARALGLAAGVPQSQLADLHLAGVLHDIGKIGVPDAILNKPSRLTPLEMEVVRQHVVVGENIVRPLRSAASVIPVVRHHHEWVDGNGYPDRLVQDDIPLAARIVAVCDGWDAMTSARPYRPALTPEQATRELRSGAGSQWDRSLVDLFLGGVLPGLRPD